MQIEIQALGFTLTPALREYTERRLRFALGWAGEQVSRVAVRLSDLNGPRGGEDKRCRVRVSLAFATAVVVEDTEADLYVAIDRAADRAGRTVSRRIERTREQRRGPYASADPRVSSTSN